MIKRMLLIIIPLAVLGGLIYSCSHVWSMNRANTAAQEAEARRVRQAVLSEVSAMVSRTGARDGWERQLCKEESYRTGPIFTLELEKVWIGSTPILFVGAVSDIITSDESHYTVLLERSGYESNYTLFEDLRLSLLAPREPIDTLLEQHPELLQDYRANRVAVIARVVAVEPRVAAGFDGSYEEVKTGRGELIEIMFTGDVPL